MSAHFNGKKEKELYFNEKKIKEAYFNGEKVFSGGPLYYCYVYGYGYYEYIPYLVETTGNHTFYYAGFGELVNSSSEFTGQITSNVTQILENGYVRKIENSSFTFYRYPQGDLNS